MDKKKNPYLELMRKHSDDELLKILNVKRKDYVADAIAAVEEVLQERGVRFKKKHDKYFMAKNKNLTIEDLKADITKRLLGHIIDVAFVLFITRIFLEFIAIINFRPIYNIEINLTYYVFYFMYFFVTEATNDGSYGRTLGKKLLRMRVTNNQGKIPSMSKIGLRTLCRFIPLDALSFLWGGNWHDNISGTYVVSDNKLKKFLEQKQ